MVCYPTPTFYDCILLDSEAIAQYIKQVRDSHLGVAELVCSGELSGFFVFENGQF